VAIVTVEEAAVGPVAGGREEDEHDQGAVDAGSRLARATGREEKGNKPWPVEQICADEEEDDERRRGGRGDEEEREPAVHSTVSPRHGRRRDGEPSQAKHDAGRAAVRLRGGVESILRACF
jgi:hypothetical protein